MGRAGKTRQTLQSVTLFWKKGRHDFICETHYLFFLERHYVGDFTCFPPFLACSYSWEVWSWQPGSEVAGTWLHSANGRHCQEKRGKKEGMGYFFSPPFRPSHLMFRGSWVLPKYSYWVPLHPLFYFLMVSRNIILFPYPLRSGQRDKVPVPPNLSFLDVSSSLLYPLNRELTHSLAVISLGAGILVLFLTLPHSISHQIAPVT